MATKETGPRCYYCRQPMIFAVTQGYWVCSTIQARICKHEVAS